MFEKKNKRKAEEFKWLRIPVVDSENDLGIVKNAKHDGSNHDFISHTVTEGEIRQLAKKYKDVNQELGKKFFKDKEDICQEIVRDINKSRDTFENILKGARAQFDQVKNNFHAALRNLRDEKVQAKQKLDFFKLNNKRNEFANIASKNSFIFMFVMFVLLTAIEISANSILISAVVKGGINEGFIVSVTVAVVNVILTALIGYFVVKQIHNISNVKKGLAYLITAAWIPAIIYMNWCVGALRTLGSHHSNLIRQDRKSTITTESQSVPPDDRTGIYEVLTDALRPWDLQSNDVNVNWELTGVLLVLLGISFAVASLVKAYLIDDTYPGYGKTSRSYINAKQAIKNKCNDLRSSCENLNQETFVEINVVKDKLDKNIKDFWETTNLIQDEADGYKKAMKANHEDTQHIIEEYQMIVTQFLKAKNREVPDRFKKKVNYYSDEDLDCDKIFKVSMHFHFDDLQREKESNSLTTKLSDSDTYAQEEIHKLSEQMNNETTEIEKTYDV